MGDLTRTDSVKEVTSFDGFVMASLHRPGAALCFSLLIRNLNVFLGESLLRFSWYFC